MDDGSVAVLKPREYLILSNLDAPASGITDIIFQKIIKQAEKITK